MNKCCPPLAWLLGAAIVSSAGCNVLLFQLGLLSGGGVVPAEYDGLSGQRVAVVAVSDNTAYGSGVEGELLARGVGKILGERVKKIELIAHDQVADWIDKNNWNELDYREVGKGVKADKVVAIDLSGFRLHDGPTLYRGRASFTVKVLDIKNEGKEVFRRSQSDISFPTTGAYHSSEMPEEGFRKTFLQVIAQQISRYFFEYNFSENYGRDPAILGG